MGRDMHNHSQLEGRDIPALGKIAILSAIQRIIQLASICYEEKERWPDAYGSGLISNIIGTRHINCCLKGTRVILFIRTVEEFATI